MCVCLGHRDWALCSEGEPNLAMIATSGSGITVEGSVAPTSFRPCEALPCFLADRQERNARATGQPTSVMPMVRSLLSAFSILLVFAVNGQSVSERAAVRLTATVQPATPSITLNWVPVSSTTSFTVYRKLKSASSFVHLMDG